MRAWYTKTFRQISAGYLWHMQRLLGYICRIYVRYLWVVLTGSLYICQISVRHIFARYLWDIQISVGYPENALYICRISVEYPCAIDICTLGISVRYLLDVYQCKEQVSLENAYRYLWDICTIVFSISVRYLCYVDLSIPVGYLWDIYGVEKYHDTFSASVAQLPPQCRGTPNVTPEYICSSYGTQKHRFSWISKVASFPTSTKSL